MLHSCHTHMPDATFCVQLALSKDTLRPLTSWVQLDTLILELCTSWQMLKDMCACSRRC